MDFDEIITRPSAEVITTTNHYLRETHYNFKQMPTESINVF